MTEPILTADEMRAAEAAAPVSLSELMDRAGRAIADAVWRYGGGRETLIACGPGNNGGDGYVAARLLRGQGLNVRVAALREPRAPLAIAARALWDGDIEPLETAQPAPVLLDCLFGTGLARPLEPETGHALTRLASAARFRFAVDLPSGVGTDDGAALGAVPMDLTLALGALKPAHCLQPSKALCGQVRTLDIGLGQLVSSLETLAAPQFASPKPTDNKFTRGYVVVVGGRMGGAAELCARAAMPLAGFVAMVGSRRHGPAALVHKRWDAIAIDPRVGAIVIGPGLGRDEDAHAKLSAALEIECPLVVDADAIHALLALRGREGAGNVAIMTPHEGEFRAFFGDLPGSKVERARAAAALCGSVIVLKGDDSVIAAPDGRSRIATGLPGWLATAGTGDVLAGLAGARLAQSGDAFAAACDAVWLHGEAARCAGSAFIADDLPGHVAAAIAAAL